MSDDGLSDDVRRRLLEDVRSALEGVPGVIGVREGVPVVTPNEDARRMSRQKVRHMNPSELDHLPEDETASKRRYRNVMHELGVMRAQVRGNAASLDRIERYVKFIAGAVMGACIGIVMAHLHDRIRATSIERVEVE